MGLPYGGAKGGVRCDPRKLSLQGAGEPHSALHRRDHADDRPRPGHPRPRHGHRRADDGVDDGHLLDDSGPARVPGVVTGKPIIIGGSAGRREATGRGHRLRALPGGRAAWVRSSKARRVAIQGFGNVGSVAARLLWNDGCLIAAVGDVKGGIWNPSGLDIRQLWRTSRGRHGGRLPRRRCDHQRRAARAAVRRAGSGGDRGSRHPQGQCRPDARPRSSPRAPTVRRRPRRT